MKSLLAAMVALLLACTLTGWPVISANADPVRADVGQRPMPEATKKKPTASATPTQTPTPTPTPTVLTRLPVDDEGERWVQIAMFAGGGLLAAVLGFFAIGSALRYTAKRRAGR